MTFNRNEQQLIDGIDANAACLNLCETREEVSNIESHLQNLNTLAGTWIMRGEISWDIFRYTTYKVSELYITAEHQKEIIRLREAMRYEEGLKDICIGVALAQHERRSGNDNY